MSVTPRERKGKSPGVLRTNQREESTFLKRMTACHRLSNLGQKTNVAPQNEAESQKEPPLVCPAQPLCIFSKMVLIDRLMLGLKGRSAVRGELLTNTHSAACQENARRRNLEHMLRMQTVNA